MLNLRLARFEHLVDIGLRTTGFVLQQLESLPLSWLRDTVTAASRAAGQGRLQAAPVRALATESR